MKKNISSYISLFIFLLILIVSFCKEDIYGNIKLSFTIGNYLNLFKFDNLKIIIISLLISFISVILLILFLFPFVKKILSLKERKQYLIIFLFLLPAFINLSFKSYLLSDIQNNILNIFLNVIFLLMPFIFLCLVFILKNINLNQMDAIMDLKINPLKGFFRIIWPEIKTKTISWISFFTLVGSNLIVLDNSIYLGSVITLNINNHIHIPYICAILCIEYLLFLFINSSKGVNK